MKTNAWTWADLDEKQLGLLKEAEQTLGMDYLLAFQPTQGQAKPPRVELKPAKLDEGQVECLVGAEEKLGAVVIAYRKRD